ncbi:MAG: ABC transporter substrate-binding protein [Bdellovibrionales bacterium]|nr:ABC transporter substrate-binding protein [Bdellovibrionales bacterium]
MHQRTAIPSERSLGIKLWSQIFVACVAIGFALILSSGCTCSKKAEIENSLDLPLGPSNLKGFDPIYANDIYTGEVVSQIFDTLYQYHYLKRPLELEPLLADGMPVASDKGLTHTIKIKKGVKFQDSEVFPEGKGRELVANDFIYSFKRLADASLKGEGFWIFDGKIKGLNEWRDKLAKGEANYDTPIEGLEAPDDHTLVIKLTRPYYQLYYVLAHAYSSPVPKEAVDKYGKEFLNHPVGTGPFKFEKWIRGTRVDLVKNPTWHGGTYPTEGEAGDQEKGLLTDAGKALPFIDRLSYHEIVESQPRWLHFMKGDLDYIEIPKDNYDSAIENKVVKPELAQKGVGLTTTEELDVTYTAFNMDDPVLGKNAKLRQALGMSLDISTLIEKFFNGRALPAHSPIPPNVDGYDPAFVNPYVEYNVEKAKKLLAEAGFPGGKGLPTFELSSPVGTVARQISEFFKESFANIGVNVTIKNLAWPQFTQQLRENKAQIWYIAWLGDYPDAENFFQLLYGPHKSPGPNASNYDNKEFNALYDKAALLPPGPERTAIYKQMRDIFVKDSPWIPNMHRLGYYLHHGWVKNFKRYNMISNSAKYFRVDMNEKKELRAKL